MISAHFPGLHRILCLGAHADDIEIGCGGSIMRLLAEHPEVEVHWVVLSACSERAEEARQSAQRFLADAARSTVVVKRFRDRFFPYCGADIKEYFFELAQEAKPDLIFTHRREDMHQDHRVVSELTWNTFRNHLILEYEIPKYEGDLGQPNVFVGLDESACERKIDMIVKSFPSQHARSWFCAESFWSLLRLRGLESGSAFKFAEAFHCRKLAL